MKAILPSWSMISIRQGWHIFTKLKTSKVAGFMKYLENLPNLRQPKGASFSSDDKEQGEKSEDEVAPVMTQFGGEDEGNESKGDSDDESLLCLTRQKRKT